MAASKQDVSPAGYAPGGHSAAVRAQHDELRIALLARDEVLAAEIEARQRERDDISEALAMCSEPLKQAIQPKEVDPPREPPRPIPAFLLGENEETGDGP